MMPTLHPMTHFPQAALSICVSVSVHVSVSHSLSHTNEALVTTVLFSSPMSSTFQNLCVHVSLVLIYFMNEQYHCTFDTCSSSPHTWLDTDSNIYIYCIEQHYTKPGSTGISSTPTVMQSHEMLLLLAHKGNTTLLNKV